MDNLNEVKQRDLAAYAEQLGYERVEARCSPHSAFLALGDDKIIVKVGDDKHYVYCNVHDDDDHGSIVDFVMKRHGCGYAKAMMTLLSLPNTSFPTGFKKHHTGNLSKASDEPDRKKCSEVWNAAEWNCAPDYLLSRGLSPDVLNDDRFVETFRTNTKGVVMFLHRDRVGMTGYELRGIDRKTGFSLKGFMGRGKRALWYSNNLSKSTSVVICESAIDCLSHHELYGWDTAFVSIAGAISTLQKDLLTGLFSKKKIIVATDNDDGGQSYFEIMQSLTSTKLERHTPIGKDWNADLCDSLKELT